MCSGCSGDYTGDFEDCGEPTVERRGGSLPRSWDETELHAKRLGRQGRGGFEADSNSQSNSQPGDLRGWNGAGAEESCEILVSATRIVEIRVIEAKSAYAGEIRGRREAAEVRTAGNHSTTASAKYYQTRRGKAENAGDGVQSGSCDGVAARIGRAFESCSRWARGVRKRLGNFLRASGAHA